MGKTFRKDHYTDALRNDSKPWYKPGKKFKNYQKQSRKAKEKESLRKIDENEIIPEFPKTDTWDWN